MTLLQLAELVLGDFLVLETHLLADAGDGLVVLALLFQTTQLIFILEKIHWHKSASASGRLPGVPGRPS